MQRLWKPNITMKDSWFLNEKNWFQVCPVLPAGLAALWVSKVDYFLHLQSYPDSLTWQTEQGEGLLNGWYLKEGLISKALSFCFRKAQLTGQPWRNKEVDLHLKSLWCPFKINKPRKKQKQKPKPNKWRKVNIWGNDKLEFFRSEEIYNTLEKKRPMDW